MSRRQRREPWRRSDRCEPLGTLEPETIATELARALPGGGIAVVGGLDRSDGRPSIVIIAFRADGGPPVASAYSEDKVELLILQIREQLDDVRKVGHQ
jgi:hypothetical protein